MRLSCSLFILCVPCGESLAADPTYWADVRPILRKHCTVCHSERKLADIDLSAGLALDKPENIRKGSQLGKLPVLVAGKPDESLREALKKHVRHEIGALAQPDDIRFTAALPKTRSGKIMRRLLKDIASGKATVGDTTTLEDYSVLAKIREDEEEDVDRMSSE
jgi:acyl-CoA synthetase (AMP-forming)/AMP-acid ligase II